MYPDRNQYVGGWAGGETGLRKWVEARAFPGTLLPVTVTAPVDCPCPPLLAARMSCARPNMIL